MKTRFLQLALATILCASLWSCEKEKITKTDDGWVDLGLPSGLLWASCNVGAEKPQDYGDYFAWGETKPKANYTEASYNYRDIYDGSNDWAKTLLPSDDAATANMGAPARMPTKEEWEELENYCESEWVKYKGKEGRKFTGPNGNSLFLPAAGYRDGSSLYRDGTNGTYWSLSLDTDNPSSAWSMDFYSDRQYVDNYYRYYGFSVRAVRSQN